MLDFIVVALPRSGTTWIASLLTTDNTLCLHDPLYHCHYLDLDSYVSSIAGEKVAGVSCTALWRWPDFVSSHTAKKLIIHRDIECINASLKSIGLPLMRAKDAAEIYDLPGFHVQFDDLFCESGAAAIWAYLMPGVEFNSVRHKLLSQIAMSPRIDINTVNKTAVSKLYSELSLI